MKKSIKQQSKEQTQRRKANKENMGHVEKLLAAIAKKHLGIETLDTRNSDSLDFHDIGVASLKEALSETFKAGLSIGAELATK